MPWVDSDTSRPQYNADGQLIGYAGSAPMYVPDKIDDYLVDEYTGVARDPMEAARMLLRGAGMQPGSYNNGAGIGYDAIEKLYASDPRFAQYFPDKRVVYQDINNLMNRQTEIDNNPGFDFGNVLLAAAASGIGALSGGFGLGDLYSQFMGGNPTVAMSSGATPGTGVAGWSDAGSWADAATASDAVQGQAMLNNAGLSYSQITPPSISASEWASNAEATDATQGQAMTKNAATGSGLPRVPTPTPGGGSKSDLGLKAATAAAGLLSQGGATGGAATGISGTLREQEAQRQANLEAAKAAINSSFGGFDDNYYSGIAKAYRDFQMPLFTEQVTRARRALPASVANTQSSAFMRKQGELEADIARQEAQIGNDAITQSNAARGNVEQSRADLLNLADAGTDASRIADQASAKALSLSAPAQFVPLADLFAKYATDAAQASALSSLSQANALLRPLLFNTGSGSRSVRTIR